MRVSSGIVSTILLAPGGRLFPNRPAATNLARIDRVAGPLRLEIDQTSEGELQFRTLKDKSLGYYRAGVAGQPCYTRATSSHSFSFHCGFIHS